MAERELARVSETVTQSLRFHRQQSKPSAVHLIEVIEAVLELFGGRLVSARIAIERDFRDCSPIIALAGDLRQLVATWWEMLWTPWQAAAR